MINFLVGYVEFEGNKPGALLIDWENVDLVIFESQDSCWVHRKDEAGKFRLKHPSFHVTDKSAIDELNKVLKGEHGTHADKD